MPEFEIQVRAGETWLKVTTVRYEADHGTRGTKRAAAVRCGLTMLSEWRASDQFVGRPMRLAENLGLHGREAFETVTGIGR